AWETERQTLPYPLTFTWGDGFSYPEKTTTDEWRWCSGRGELHITNPSPRDKLVSLSMGLWSLHSEPVPLFIQSALFSAEAQVSTRDFTLERTFTLPPGHHIIHFRCAGEKVNVKGDSRELVFMVRNLRATETRLVKNLAVPVPAAQTAQRPE